MLATWLPDALCVKKIRVPSLDHAGADHMIFKHAIAAITTSKPAASYFSRLPGG